MLAPGLAPEAAGDKTVGMRKIAKKAGVEVCGQEVLSLSVGQAVYPDDGSDAEKLLAEADRRMYQEKQRQPNYKGRRASPRMVCRFTVTLEVMDSSVQLLGTVSDISLSGCYVEMAAILSPGSKVRIFFSPEDSTLHNDGVVVRAIPGAGLGIEFLKSTTAKCRIAF